MSLLLFALMAAPASGQPEPRDWGAALRMDAQAIHDDIAANHPGPVNPADPGFAARNDAEFKRALERANAVKTFAAYFYALRQYVASFNDGHLNFGVSGATPEDYRWPGFLTRYDLDGQQRVFTAADWSPVPIGARMVACDGKPADRVTAEIMAPNAGRWNLLSQRQFWGSFLFTNTSNPYVTYPQSCTFEVDGKEKAVKLERRPSDFESMFDRLWGGQKHDRVIDMRTLPDGMRWLRMNSFDGDPNSETGKALGALLAALGAKREAVRSAPAIVLDIRGNNGGSSDWSMQIAKLLWGEGAIAAVSEPPMTITWRASEANLKTVRDTYEERKNGLSPDAIAYFKSTIAGLEGAIKDGKPDWSSPPDPVDVTGVKKDLPVYKRAGPVYVITDASCMSACLDAVDLWRSLGAIHLGQETSADTLYMEIRQDKLPSGLGAVSLPMKVYRGRPRGSNVPVVPQHPYSGDITDTAKLEAWVAGLRTEAPKKP